MTLAPTIFKCLPAILLIAGPAAAVAASEDEARVTRVIRDVELLPPQSKAVSASVNDTVAEDTGVRTGEESRSELTFTDLTITRLGANTVFSFNKGGHDVQLNAGSMLLYVPKNSGGAHMATDAVSVAITGSTAILRAKGGRSVLTMLEDSARVSLIKHPSESVYVRPGQMLVVPAGATKMPKPFNINLKQAMKSPLITDFPPLPSQDAILAGTKKTPVHRSRPAGPSGGSGRPVVGRPGGGGGGRPVVVPGQSGGQPVVVNPTNPGNPGKPKKPKKPRTPKPTPTPTPVGPGGGTGKPPDAGDQTGETKKPPRRPKKPTKRPRPRPTPTPTPVQIQ